MFCISSNYLTVFTLAVCVNCVDDVLAVKPKQRKIGFERLLRREGLNCRSNHEDVGLRISKTLSAGISQRKNLKYNEMSRYHVELKHKSTEGLNDNSLDQSFTAKSPPYATTRNTEIPDDVIPERKVRSLGTVCSKYDSCHGRCHNNNNNRSIDNQEYNCYCDDLCYLVYQDCCYDYELYCGKQQHDNNKKQALDHSMVSCVVGYDVSGKYIWMVSKCSRGWLNKETLYKCQNISTSLTFQVERIYEFLPVTDANNVTYRNEFCARCNHIDNFHYFSLNITCPILPPASLSSLQDIISFLLRYCGDNHINFVPNQHVARRYCSIRVRQNCEESEDAERCTEGSVAVVTAQHQNFKNIWCAQCNGVPENELKCGLKISQGMLPFNYGRKFVASFSIIMKNPEQWRVSLFSRTCPTGKIFDPSLQICRLGKLMPPVKDLVDKYLVVMWLENLFPPKTFTTINTTELRATLGKKFQLNDTQIAHLTIHKMVAYYIVEFQLSLTNVQSLTVSLTPTQFSLEFLGESLSAKDLLHFTRECVIEVSSDLFKIFKVTSRRLACIGKKSYTREEYVVLKNRRYHIMSSNQTFSSTDVYHHNGTNITICNDFVPSTCKGFQIYLAPEEYTRFPNLSVYYKRSHELYEIGEYSVRNNTVILCTNISFNTSMRGVARRTFDDIVMEVLTILTFTLSLLSLAALIFTYIVFSELRKLPGKNLLNLAISLFLAQLLWLLGVSQTTWPQFCTMITIIEHYLFLVTFTAMSVIAFHTKTTLASKKLRIPATLAEDRKRFIVYCGFVWGVPLLFISITTFLHEYEVYDVGYSSRHERTACWITRKEAQELFFALPVGILLMFNTAMFIYTIVMIQVKKRNRRELQASINKHQEHIWIYLKLSSLTGLTWIFGFLDILVDSRVFSVMFVIFASLQGFYIALSFLVNDRVVKLYRELMMRLVKRSVR